MVARAPAGRLPRTAPRGPAAVPVPRLGRVSGGPGGRTLRFLAGKGVGELRSVKTRKAAGLEAMGIETVLDLLMHYPRRYVDRRHQSEIASLVEDEEAMVTATMRRISSRRTRGGKTMVQAVVEDASGRLQIVFFNQPWRAKQLPVNSEVVVFGRVEIYRGVRQMTNPVVDLDRGPDGPHRADLSTVGQGRRSDRPRSPATSPRRSSAPGELAEVLPPAWLEDVRPRRPDGRVPGHPRPGDLRGARATPAAGWPSTSCSGSSSSSS